MDGHGSKTPKSLPVRPGKPMSTGGKNAKQRRGDSAPSAGGIVGVGTRSEPLELVESALSGIAEDPVLVVESDASGAAEAGAAPAGGADSDTDGAAGKRPRIDGVVEEPAREPQHPADVAAEERSKVQLMSEWCAMVKLYDTEKRKAHVRVSAAAKKVDEVAGLLARLGVYMPINFSD